VNAVLDKEAWRYSERAWKALHAQPFAQPGPTMELPDELAARLAALTLSGIVPRVFVNGHDTLAEFRLRDGERLHLVFVNVPGASAVRWERELTVTLGSGSAEIIEQHIGADGADILGAVTSRVQVGAGAHLHMTTLCDLPDTASLHRREQVSVDRHGAYSSTHALFGGRLQRFDLDVAMAGEQSSYASHGVFVPRRRQHIDVHLDARHDARDTRSEVFWRGVADQRGRGILHGAITVAAGADGADAQLQTKNLLLSPHAEIDAQPVLEIYADEVKASHGATVGQLDERALFYLRSRGVPLAAARNLLIAGFCREAFAGVVDQELRTQLESVLAARLPQVEEAR
jgi:Fe-S cluster assembly protein SufD